MKTKKWKWFVVVFLIAWALYEIYPPSARNLVTVFREESIRQDKTFTDIVGRAQDLEKKFPGRSYANLKEAVGTNDLQPYFVFDVKNETDHNAAILNRLQKSAAGKIKLGLDLQGGIEFLVRLDTNRVAEVVGTNAAANAKSDRNHSLEQAIAVLRKRVDKFGIAEPVFQPQGSDRILIQLPGLSQADRDEAVATIQKAAYLEFRMVHPNSAELLSSGIIEPGYEKLQEIQRPNQPRPLPLLVEKKARMTGQYIKRAVPSFDSMSNEPEIQFALNSQGAAIFGELTRQNVGHRLAIVLDGELYSAPEIKSPILEGNGVISMGQSDIKEAITLANVLENPMETPVILESVREVGPSLGQDTIRSGVRSAIFGTLAVAVFMAVYYMRAGMIANIAMLINLLVLVGVMCSIGTTLTLPGIAGIVLTVGMAVDANVLIYERLREEMAHGKSMRGALSAAYDRAFSTIFDSHLTTLISAVILIFMGTGPVQGFGVTLTIGVALSLFTALFVTRLIFDYLLANNWLNKVSMLHIIKNPHLDFMKLARYAFAASWAVIIIGMGWGFHRGDDVLGVDFAGGDSVDYRFSQRVGEDQIRSSLKKINITEAQIQYQKSPGDNLELLKVVTPFKTGDTATAQLAKDFPQSKFQVAGKSQVGPTVGEEIKKSALIASFLSLFGILIYVAFRYEYSFAVGAVVAVIHDVLMTIGVFFMAGRQLSAPMVAAILTIIGFSINDTIVIFDRIREDLKLGGRGSFKDIINKALNETLSRTIITSGTVFLATMSLYLFGGGAINDFAFTFLVGIITGTYSSIYIASALVLWWHKGERPRNTSVVQVDSAAAAETVA